VEIGGIHLDISSKHPKKPYRCAAHWIGIPAKPPEKKTRYTKLNIFELEKHDLI
jgi:hypothetical protein